MKWMVGNAVVKPDVNNNYKPFKAGKSSTQRIDGVVTAIMAIDRCNADGSGSGAADFNDVLKLF
jgi:phage terminase large subunit-like protein